MHYIESMLGMRLGGLQRTIRIKADGDRVNKV